MPATNPPLNSDYSPFDRPAPDDAPYARRVSPDQAGPRAADPAEERARRVARLTALAAFLDSAIELPGVRTRVGFDALIGLVPGVGDALSAGLALYIVYEARKLGASKRQIAAMLGNVAIDTLAGSVPILGDIFDLTFKANVRNLRMLGIDAGRGVPPRKR